jgi:hypothetical protein
MHNGDLIMRRILCFIATCLFFSCSNENKTDVLRKKFVPYLQGTWVKTDYINDIAKTKSPFRSYSKLGGVVSLVIDAKDATEDSLQVGFSLNDHEGTDFYLFFKPGLLPSALPANLRDYDNPANFYELGYIHSGADTSLVLYRFSPEKKLIDSVRFTKAHQYTAADNDVGEGIAWIVNKVVIAGTYRTFDSSGKESTVHFSEDNKVTGFGGFTNYMLITDFLGPDQHDFLGFGNGDRRDSVFYGWEMNNDSIKLYATQKGADRELIIDKLRYILKKQ